MAATSFLPAPDPTPNQVAGLPQNQGQLTPNNAAYYQQTGPVATPNNPNYYNPNYFNQNGQVLGASTSAPSGGGSSSAGYDSLLSAANQGINSQYDTYLAGLDKQYGTTAQDKQSLLDKVYNLFGTTSEDPSTYGSVTTGNLGLINSSQQGALEQLNNSKTQVDTRQAQTLRDLEQNLTNQYQAANRQLGALGAGDSSAVGQYQYALARLGSQQRSKVLQQANDLYNQINLKISDVNRAAKDQISQLVSWKNDNLLNIQKNYTDTIAAIDKEKAGANAQRAADLNNIMLQIKSQAISALQNTQQAYDQGVSAANNWYQQHYTDYSHALGQIQNYTGNPGDIGNSANFNVPISLGNTGGLTLGNLMSGGQAYGGGLGISPTYKKDQNGGL